ncbi:hypothetical protein OJF2_65240 [Aquisphaera giovannonii]|uniref:Phage terminase, small subunit n=1 Tax=Aquisphaera giovannonii TaxID=406548 RepID=A0A5B9WCH4_9BACT|nr:P27 family phage terminase small subunit [Aquisphaera giovannonii]QEH37929.1 hypothetical protein OJF2_65240 [Aquisphaera giovannonii]
MSKHHGTPSIGMSPEPPGHLSEGSAALWRSIVRDYNFGQYPEALAILLEAMNARDRAEQARLIIAAEGITVCDGRNSIKGHPCVAIAKEAQNVFISAMKALRLDPDSSAKGVS